jgi:hypothetical protein
MSTELAVRTTVKLTSDQKKLVRGVPGLAERVARDATKRFGPIKPMEVMVRSAHYGIALAAQTFDEARDLEFVEWAYLKALWTIVDDARAERRQEDQIAAARCAVIEFLRFEHRAPRDEDAYATEEEDRAELDRYKAGVIAAYLKGIAVMPLAAGGEDEMISRVDATRSATALSKAYEGFRPDQLELLACECEADLQALAPKWGRSWWTLGRARSKLLKLVGARLAGQKVDQMPAWDDEVWAAAARTHDGPTTSGPVVP